MRSLTILIIPILLCSNCSAPKDKKDLVKDSTSVSPDSIANALPLASGQSGTNSQYDPDNLSYTILNQSGFISDPFDFELNSQSLREILGSETQITEQDFEGGDDYNAYRYTTVVFHDSKMGFYSYSGKHSADIRTPLLRLKNNIKVGMSKAAFLEAMQLTAEDASLATLYQIIDDFGEMKFHFQSDTLYWIHVNYEEGD